MTQPTTFDNVSNFVFGVFDRVSQGVTSYFDTATAFNEAEARLKQAQAEKRSYDTINDLETGSAASSWGNVDVPNFDLGSTQGLLVVAGVGLAAVALLRSAK